MNKKVLVISALLLSFAALTTPLNQTMPSGSSTYYVAGASQNSLEVTSTITLSNSSICVAVNEETNRVYVGCYGALLSH